MNRLLKTIFIFSCTATSFFASSQEYQKITGTYLNVTESCDCNSLGFLKYVDASGVEKRMYLCFDSEPGSHYEIFNNEKITVEGVVTGMACGKDGKTFLTMYVQKSVLPMQNRREIVPEFIKQQNQNLPKSQSNLKSASSGKEQVMTGYYTEKGSTKDDWSDCSHCTNCGRLNNDRSVTINFDRLSEFPTYHISKLKVVGYREGRNFFVTRWEIIQQ